MSLPGGLGEQTHTEQLLEPGAEALTGLHEALERLQGLIVLVGVGALLIVAGAKLERYLLKRQLEVVQGGAEPEPVAKEKAGGGRR